jgi:hypothetical protein
LERLKTENRIIILKPMPLLKRLTLNSSYENVSLPADMALLPHLTRISLRNGNGENHISRLSELAFLPLERVSMCNQWQHLSSLLPLTALPKTVTRINITNTTLSSLQKLEPFTMDSEKANTCYLCRSV